MEELDVMSKLSNVFGSLMLPNKDVAYIEKINKHKQWLATIRHEHPSPHKKYKIGVYIRYFNQTKYDDYLKYHIQQFYRDEFDAEFDKWFETLGYDRKGDENKEQFAEDRAEYINTHLDRTRWSNRLDKELFDQFLDFYNDNIDK